MALISSSATVKPNCSSSAVIRLMTAIQIELGNAAKQLRIEIKASTRLPSCRVSPRMALMAASDDMDEISSLARPHRVAVQLINGKEL